MFTGILGVKSRIFCKTSSMIFINDSVCLECRGTLYISGIKSFRFCHDYHLICSISSLHRSPPGNFVYCLASMPMPQWNQVESKALQPLYILSLICPEPSLLLWWSNQLMCFCAAGENGCTYLTCMTFPLDGQVSADRNRCPRSTARRAIDVVAFLQQNSACWMQMRMERLPPV